jgi:hypothetical protein
MTTNADKARIIREAIFARSDEEGGAISREQMKQAIEGALNKMTLAPTGQAADVSKRRLQEGSPVGGRLGTI